MKLNRAKLSKGRWDLIIKALRDAVEMREGLALEYHETDFKMYLKYRALSRKYQKLRDDLIFRS
jgi:hypothetical protein